MSQHPPTIGNTLNRIRRALNPDLWHPKNRHELISHARGIADDLQPRNSLDDSLRVIALGAVLTVGIVGLFGMAPLTLGALVLHTVLADRWGPNLTPGSIRVRGRARTIVLAVAFGWQALCIITGLGANPEGSLALWPIISGVLNIPILIAWVQLHPLAPLPAALSRDDVL